MNMHERILKALSDARFPYRTFVSSEFDRDTGSDLVDLAVFVDESADDNKIYATTLRALDAEGIDPNSWILNFHEIEDEAEVRAAAVPPLAVYQPQNETSREEELLTLVRATRGWLDRLLAPIELIALETNPCTDLSDLYSIAHLSFELPSFVTPEWPRSIFSTPLESLVEQFHSPRAGRDPYIEEIQQEPARQLWVTLSSSTLAEVEVADLDATAPEEDPAALRDLQADQNYALAA